MLLLMSSASVAAGVARVVPTIWPLCGRIGEAPGSWTHGSPCPDREARHDLPIHNGYGYRAYVEDRPISFHRGLDLATRAATANNGFVGNPFFAACSGFVYRVTGLDPDRTLELKCPEDPQALVEHGDAACSVSPCITAVYRHVRGLTAAVGMKAEIGSHLGYSGQTAPLGNVFEHLHFEILDPRSRPTNGNGGVTAFSKDAVNPLNYLPPVDEHVQTGSQVPIDAALPPVSPFAGYAGPGVALAVEFRATEGFAHNFDAATVEVFNWSEELGAWSRVAKDGAAVAVGTGGIPLPGEYSGDLQAMYEVAGGDANVSRFDPQRLNSQYSPFSAGSGLWETEKQISYFRTLFASQHPGLDGLMEKNALGMLPNGHRVLDFDLKLVAPFPNPDESVEAPPDPSTWWGFTWGLREFGASIPQPLCVRVEVSVLPTVPGGQRKTRRIVLPRPVDAGCPDASGLERVFRDGLENG